LAMRLSQAGENGVAPSRTRDSVWDGQRSLKMCPDKTQALLSRARSLLYLFSLLYNRPMHDLETAKQGERPYRPKEPRKGRLKKRL